MPFIYENPDWPHKAGVLVRNPGGGRSTSYRLVEPDKIHPA